MKELTKEELNNIKAGDLTGAFITGIVKAFNCLYELGKSLGSSIRRYTTKKYC